MYAADGNALQEWRGIGIPELSVDVQTEDEESRHVGSGLACLLPRVDVSTCDRIGNYKANYFV